MDEDPFKGEGPTAATVHEVAISTCDLSELTALEAKQKRTEKTLAEAQSSLSSLESYIGTVNAEHLDVDGLKSVVKSYDEIA